MSEQDKVGVNITETDTNDSTDGNNEPAPTTTPQTNGVTSDEKIDLLKVEINDDNAALNVIVGFLGIAQRRGIFAINESAKIYECIQQFQKTE